MHRPSRLIKPRTPRKGVRGRCAARSASGGASAAFLSEKEVSSFCRKLIHAVGGFTYSLSQPRHTMQSEGIPDCIAFVPEGFDGFAFAFVEFKRPASPGKRAGKQSAAQIEFQAFCNAARIRYVLGGVPEVRAWLSDLGRLL